MGYNHYIAVDWSIKNMAIARMTGKSNKVTMIDVPAEIGELKLYLKNLKGSKVLAFEETTTSQWLYTELKGLVDRLIVCDPVRNHLLSEGPKDDGIDATKLVQLLRADLLKEVYHSSEKFLELRRLMSGYEDLVKATVRLKNQRYSLLRACGCSGEEKIGTQLNGREMEQKVLECIERQLECCGKEKEIYEGEFRTLARKHAEIRHQMSLPGVGPVGAMKIVSRIVSPERFITAGHFLSYAGLVKLERKSGGVLYGRKNSRYNRELKSVYKTGVSASIGGNNPINDYYEYLMNEKRYPEYQARHKAARRLAVLSLGVFKSRQKYNPKYRRKDVDKSQANN